MLTQAHGPLSKEPAMNMPEEKTLLIVEDDRPLRERLARAMEARGFTVALAESVAEGKAKAKETPRALRWAGWPIWSTNIEQPGQPASGQPCAPGPNMK